MNVPRTGHQSAPGVGLIVGPGVGLAVGLPVGLPVTPLYMVSLYLPIATGFVLLHAGRTSTHMGVLRNTASGDGAVGREGNTTAQKTNVECEAP